MLSSNYNPVWIQLFTQAWIYICQFHGFRDIFKKLREVFNFIPKIPYCNQIDSELDNSDSENEKMNQKNSKQLTTKQANESRLVTKVMLYF